MDAYSGKRVSQKRKGALTHTTPWMNPEDIMVSELSHPQRANRVLLHRHEAPPGNQTHRDRKEGACQGVGGGRLGSDCLLGTEVQFGRWRNSGDGCGDGCMSV